MITESIQIVQNGQIFRTVNLISQVVGGSAWSREVLCVGLYFFLIRVTSQICISQILSTLCVRMSLKNNNNRGCSCYGIKCKYDKLFAKVSPLRKSHFLRKNCWTFNDESLFEEKTSFSRISKMAGLMISFIEFET